MVNYFVCFYWNRIDAKKIKKYSTTNKSVKKQVCHDEWIESIMCKAKLNKNGTINKSSEKTIKLKLQTLEEQAKVDDADAAYTVSNPDLKEFQDDLNDSDVSEQQSSASEDDEDELSPIDDDEVADLIEVTQQCVGDAPSTQTGRVRRKPATPPNVPMESAVTGLLIYML